MVKVQVLVCIKIQARDTYLGQVMSCIDIILQEPKEMLQAEYYSTNAAALSLGQIQGLYS